MQRKFLLSTAAALAVATTPMLAPAQDMDVPGEFSANVALTNVYVFRGIDQTDENPAIQGGFDWAHDSGIYLGTWASNVDFNDGDEATLELDVYGGFAGSLGQVGYDVGVLYYAYPGADTPAEYDFWEIYGSLGFDVEAFSFGAGIAYSPDFFGESDTGIYYSGSVAVALTEALSADVGIGYQTIDDNAAWGTPDYVDWQIGATYAIGMFAIDARYAGTDLDENECFGGSDLCDGRFIISLSASF